jgi:hypothetical protein
VGALDDPYLINRQFARIGIEELFGVSLKEFGYQFYMTPDERRQPIEKIHEHLKTTPAAKVTPALPTTSRAAIREPRVRIQKATQAAPTDQN